MIEYYNKILTDCFHKLNSVCIIYLFIDRSSNLKHLIYSFQKSEFITTTLLEEEKNDTDGIMKQIKLKSFDKKIFITRHFRFLLYFTQRIQISAILN